MPSEPKPKRESLWDRKRSDWYKDAARSEIRGHSMPLLWVFGLSAVVLFGNGLSSLGGRLSWLSLGSGALFALTVWGLQTNRGWARWVGGLSAGVMAFGLLVALLVGLMSESSITAFGWLTALGLIAVWGRAAYGLLGPESGALFERARDGAENDD